MKTTMKNIKKGNKKQINMQNLMVVKNMNHQKIHQILLYSLQVVMKNKWFTKKLN